MTLGDRNVIALRLASMDDPAISIVIVNWNAASLLHRCLRSIEPQLGPDAEVILVDNGSTDESLGLVQRDFPWVVVHPQEVNAGFAEGCNLGIAASRGRWVVTLNNDATAATGWLDALRAATGDEPGRVGMMQCRMLFASDPSRLNSTGVQMFDDGCAEDRHYGALAHEMSPGRDIFCPTAGAALYRRAMLDEVKLETGWFDREFFLYGEDVDLGWRCRLAGWDAVYVPAATVHHEAHATTGRKGWRFVKAQCAKNRLRTLIKNASPGFLARSLGRTAYDLLRIPALAGPRALADTILAARRSARLREEVGRLARMRREEVERRWAVPRGAR